MLKSKKKLVRKNPDYDVYFLFATNETHVDLEITPLMKALLSYSNLNLRYFNMIEYSKGTPLENFIASNELAKSKFEVVHTSDVMRMFTLYKYGGVYLDLDVISIIPLRMVNLANFGCLEWHDEISNAFLGIDLKDGRKVSAEYIR